MDEGFDNYDTGVRPPGWVFTNCDQNSDVYTGAGYYGHAAPSLKLDETGDIVETAAFANGDWLQFWLKGTGTDDTSHLLVEEYSSGAWNEITDILPLPTSGTEYPQSAPHELTTRNAPCLAAPVLGSVYGMLSS